jgi:hypothetical protein
MVLYGTSPASYSGTVYDRGKEVISARCRLTSRQVIETYTDSYGDFWCVTLPSENMT